jgi:hypothetical protein
MASRPRLADEEEYNTKRISLGEVARCLGTHAVNLKTYADALEIRVGDDETVNWRDALIISMWYIESGALRPAREAPHRAQKKERGALIVQGGRPESKRG